MKYLLSSPHLSRIPAECFEWLMKLDEEGDVEGTGPKIWFRKIFSLIDAVLFRLIPSRWARGHPLRLR